MGIANDNISGKYYTTSLSEMDRINEVKHLVATSLDKGADSMDENKILEMYISKFEKDNIELKNDIRETEKKMDERLNRIEDIITAQNNKIDDKLERINDKIDSKFTILNDKVDKVKDDITKNSNEQRMFWIGIVISSLVGIGGIVATIIAAI